MKKTLRLAFAVVLTLALVISSMVFASAATQHEVASWDDLVTACANAQDGDTINITGTISGSDTLEIKSDVTITGNGSVTFSNNGFKIFGANVVIDGDLTLIREGNGANDKWVIGVFDDGTNPGSLTVENANITNFILTDEGVDPEHPNTVTINDGTFYQQGHQIITGWNSNIVTTVNGGTFIGDSANQPIIWCNDSGAKTYIYGGTFTKTGSDSNAVILYLRNSIEIVIGKVGEAGPSMTHQGGTHVMKLGGGITNGSITFNSGEFVNNGTNGYIFDLNESSTVPITINGGTWTNTRDIIRVNDGGIANFTINGGTFNASADGQDIIQKNNGTLTVTGGTFNHSAAGNAIVSVNGKNNGNLTINNTNNIILNHTGAGAFLKYDSTCGVTVKGLNITRTGDNGKIIEITNGGTISLEDCSLISDQTPIVATGDAGLTIKNSTILSRKTDNAIEGTTYTQEGTNDIRGNTSKVTVTFDENGAVSAVEPMQTDADGKLTSLPTVLKTGYKFDGWYTALQGGEMITTDTVFNINTTVYAQWSVCDHSESTAQPTCGVSAICTVCGNSISETGVHVPVWKFDANQHWQECDDCGILIGEKADHTGGTADCQNEKVCSEANCGQKYGEKDANNHTSPEYTYTSNDRNTHTKAHKCCGTVVDALEEHVYDAEDRCVCGATKCDHSESTAQPTCGAGATCSICGNPIPATGNHTLVWKFDANQHWQECDGCGTLIGEKADHTGGTADCKNEAVCSEVNCGQKYGEKDMTNHTSPEFTYTPNSDGTTHTKANKCCGTVINAQEAHDYAETGCVCGAKKVYEFKTEEETKQVITIGEEATFTSVADFDKFVEVKVDGKTLVKDTDYTVVSGSTKVTLKADFVKTLAAGEHKLEIISTNGAAATNFTVKAAPVADDNNQGGTTTPDAGTTTPDAGTTTPDADANSGSTAQPEAGSNNVGTSDKTGDITNFMIIFALFVLSGLSISAAVVYGKKRRVR